MCVYIYLFITDWFLSWYVKVDLYPQLLGPLDPGDGVNILPLYERYYKTIHEHC